MSTRPSPTSSSTSTCESGSGWQSGIRLLVALPPMIPASCAVVERVALRQVAQPARRLGRHQHGAARDGHAPQRRLVPDVDHLHRARRLVDVRQLVAHAAIARRLRAGAERDRDDAASCRPGSP